MNLASNMISGDGLELLLEDLIKNTNLKQLDIGVLEGSIRKNSLGIQGAVCISALLIRNKTLVWRIINSFRNYYLSMIMTLALMVANAWELLYPRMSH